MKLQLQYSHEELVVLQTAIIVECYERVMGSGSNKRAFKEEFTEEEQKKFKKYHKNFYSWHLIKGIPHNGFIFQDPSDYQLTQRFVAFFAIH